MQIDVIDRKFILEIYGFSGRAINKDYVGMAFSLSDKMWKAVKQNNLKNKGQNVWVYDANEEVFAGVELYMAPTLELERKNIVLTRYAYHKHVGSYSLIKQTGLAMRNELTSRGLVITGPYLEIYGHWTNDEHKLETELIMALK